MLLVGISIPPRHRFLRLAMPVRIARSDISGFLLFICYFAARLLFSRIRTYCRCRSVCTFPRSCFSYWSVVPRVWFAFWLSLRCECFQLPRGLLSAFCLRRVPRVWVCFYCFRVRFGVSISKSTAKVLLFFYVTMKRKNKNEKILIFVCKLLIFSGWADIPNNGRATRWRWTSHLSLSPFSHNTHLCFLGL